MTREQAANFLRKELDLHGLNDWHIRITAVDKGFLGLCSYKDKCIIINAHHIDIHSDPDLMNTIRHEVAHAIVGPTHGHNEVWASKAKEIGCDNTAPCSNLMLSPDVIDAIRSGADVQVTYETEVIRRPKYEITRLQDKCDFCGKVAKSKSEKLIENDDPFKPNIKMLILECGHTLIKRIPKGTPFQTLVSDNDEELVKSCKHEFNKNICLNCGKYRPFPFQVEGMQFVEQALAINKGAAIFDEMGLGKTIQALGYLRFHPEAFPVLYVVKSAIKFQWFKQILTWMGPEYMPQIISGSNDYLIPGLKGYIISYDIVVPKTRKSKNGKEIKQGFDIKKFDGLIKTVILDECQQIKNPDSTRTQQIRRIVKDKNVIALSGTPWKNRGSEFFSVLNMLAPIKFYSYEAYIRQWVDRWMEGNRCKEGGIRSPERFKEYIKDIALRREISDVAIEMPDVTRTPFHCNLDDLEQDTYDDAEGEFVKWYNDLVIGGDEEKLTGMQILAKLSRMRHIMGLAKIPATVEFAEEFFEETDRKLCIFFHHKDVGEILYQQFQEKFGKDIPVMKLTAELNDLERFEMQERFNKHPRAFMIASTLASGEGINLQTCSDAILHERQWNPQNEDQAAPGRFRRIGARTDIPVSVTYILAEGTVDTILHGIVERKRVYFHKGMNKGEALPWNENDFAKDMAEQIVKRWREKNKNKVKVEGKKTIGEILQV
jgi:hypothetical protein